MRFWLQVTRKFFEDMRQEAVEERPIILTGFLNFTPDDSPIYEAVASYEVLKKALDDQLRAHNESNAVMELVLFQQVNKSKSSPDNSKVVANRARQPLIRVRRLPGAHGSDALSRCMLVSHEHCRCSTPPGGALQGVSHSARCRCIA